MPKRYFRLKEDKQVGNWALGDPLDERGQEVDDPYVFREGRPVHVEGRLTIPVEAPGRRLEFCTAGLGAAPIVHVRLASLFAELAPDDVQLIPVDVQGQPDQYLILVATKLIRGIDDDSSEEVLHWQPEDGQPERVGEYKSVIGLRIDPTKVGDARVFRTWGWDIALIISEDIKRALERVRATGATFTEV
ncbi:imm11 family protein [Myxococcus sp. RHSTA-1-4]|uniref:imm11 family protein n=1 Tax=Myxococcus sp. RHSTA-1-4 TaxID=2874601 RepID=UPI001CC18D21|nr:DUF1629 domain-containing protein [Myxococcus sp. RHSTA-1-4]MBZ4421586.1 hypothetical protein [Myxococcus sp. RHSTA-1-4]